MQQEIDGTRRDYLLIEYAEGDKLYVPVEQLDRVTRYVGPEGGEQGGTLVACGTPEEVAANPASYTGQFLKEKLR